MACWFAQAITIDIKIKKATSTLSTVLAAHCFTVWLGQGPKRLVAKTMAWTALTNNVFSAQHARVLLKRSIMDLVASFVHEAEETLAQA